MDVDPIDVGKAVEGVFGRRRAKWFWIVLVVAMATIAPVRNYVFGVWQRAV